MGPGPMVQAAADALQMRAKLCDSKEFEALEFVEIDCVDAVKRLMRDGSLHLRQALSQIVLSGYPAT